MKKKTGIRIGIVIIIVCVICFSDWSFAAEESGLQNFGIYLNYFVNMLARLWIVFAKLAGTFLTNRWVYGEILGWDVLLWKFWNVIKNIANFGLGFYFVYEIFKGLISKEGVKDLKGKILWLLVAGVGIQASRFLTAAIVDVSTITLSGVGSFPAQVISRSKNAQESLVVNLSGYLDATWQNRTGEVIKGKEISVFPKKSDMTNFVDQNWVVLAEPESFTGLVNDLLPDPESVDGPLYYLGFSILEATNSALSIKIDSNQSIKQMIFGLLFNGLTTVIFAIEMCVLCVLALMRILYLRMFIILSPIAVLLWCMEKLGQKVGGDSDSFLSKFMKQINLKSFLINVFKPTIIVLGFGVAMLFSSLMSSVIKQSMGNSVQIGDTNITSKKNPLSPDGKEQNQTYNTTMDNNLIEFTLLNASKTFLDFILSIITVLMVYFIIKIAVQMGKGDDFVSKGISELQGSVGDMIGSVPVVPVAGYDKDGVNQTRWLSAKSIFDPKSGESELLNKKLEYSQASIDDKINEQKQVVDSLFGKSKSYLPEGTKNDINTSIADTKTKGISALEDVKGKIGQLSNDLRKDGVDMRLNGVGETSKWWVGQFSKRLEGMKGKPVTGTKYNTVWDNMIKRWNDDSNKNNRTLENMFKKDEPNNVKAYADLFGLSLSSSKWDQLKNADISKK